VEIGSPANIDANAAPAMINPNLRCANAAAESVRADAAPIISVRNIGNPPVLARRKWFAAARPRTAGRIDHIIRASPNERRTGVDGSDFLDWPEAWMRGADGSGIPDCPNGVRGSHLAIFPDIGTHSSGVLALNARPSKVLRQRWWWLRPQFRDEPQNLLEHLPWDGDLGHLEGDIAAVAHDFCADLDQLLLQACQ